MLRQAIVLLIVGCAVTQSLRVGAGVNSNGKPRNVRGLFDKMKNAVGDFVTYGVYTLRPKMETLVKSYDNNVSIILDDGDYQLNSLQVRLNRVVNSTTPAGLANKANLIAQIEGARNKLIFELRTVDTDLSNSIDQVKETARKAAGNRDKTKLLNDTVLRLQEIQALVRGEIKSQENQVKKDRVLAVKTPVVEVPSVITPEVEVPAVITPEVEVPAVITPEIITPEVKVPEVEIPAVLTPEVQVPEVITPEVEVPEVKVPEVQVPEVKVPNGRDEKPKSALTESIIKSVDALTAFDGVLAQGSKIAETDLTAKLNASIVALKMVNRNKDQLVAIIEAKKAAAAKLTGVERTNAQADIKADAEALTEKLDALKVNINASILKGKKTEESVKFTTYAILRGANKALNEERTSMNRTLRDLKLTIDANTTVGPK